MARAGQVNHAAHPLLPRSQVAAVAAAGVVPDGRIVMAAGLALAIALVPVPGGGTGVALVQRGVAELRAAPRLLGVGCCCCS